MNNLKKALARDDPRKYYINKIEFSGLKKTVPWNQLNFPQKKPEKKALESSLDEIFRKTVDSHFSNGELKEVPKLMKELTSIYKEFRKDESRSSEAVASVLQILRNMAKHQQGVLLKKQIQTSVEGLQCYIKEKKQRQKQKCLSEFNKFVDEMHPKAKEKAATLKLLHSTSAGNLKITVTREEYQFQEEAETGKKKSLDFKSNSKASNSNKNLDSNKLQMFLRDSNIKLVKTKIQYDYSAILEASKSNIQPRNKTTVQPKNEKEVITKASNGRKNQGFVFYRPHKKH